MTCHTITLKKIINMYYKYIAKDKAEKLLRYGQCKVYKISDFNKKPIEISKYSYSLSFFNTKFCVEIPKEALKFRIKTFKTLVFKDIVHQNFIELTNILEFLKTYYGSENNAYLIAGFKDENYKMSVDEDFEKEVYEQVKNWLNSCEFKHSLNDLRASLQDK